MTIYRLNSKTTSDTQSIRSHIMGRSSSKWPARTTVTPVQVNSVSAQAVDRTSSSRVTSASKIAEQGISKTLATSAHNAILSASSVLFRLQHVLFAILKRTSHMRTQRHLNVSMSVHLALILIQKRLSVRHVSHPATPVRLKTRV